MRLAIAAALAITGFVFSAPPALADAFHPAFDPQTSNVPYLAWLGEDVRLVYCEPTVNGTKVAWGGTGSYAADAWISRWSGDSISPHSGSATFFTQTTTSGTRNCVKVTYSSEVAGLAVVRLDIYDTLTSPRVRLVRHDFLVGWLAFSKVALDDSSGGTQVYDAPGWGNYNWLRARVMGRLPLTSSISSAVCPATGVKPAGCIPTSIQLPAEDKGVSAGTGDTTTWWDDLAQKMADTSAPDAIYQAQKWLTWDIHDDMSDAAGNVDSDPADSKSTPPSAYAGVCDPIGVDNVKIKDTSIDAVDNCQGGLGEEGPFSRIWPTLTSGLAVGPFDPLRPDATFVGDGKLDAGDVPMPPARIDFTINPNSGAADDVSGTGTLEALDKEDVYIRDPQAGHDAPHNMYAPFYRAYIPATRAELAGDTAASGTDASGFQNSYPVNASCDPAHRTPGDDCSYPYWEKEATLASVAGSATQCLRRHNGTTPEYRSTPNGDQSIVVYSDEHGEAMVQYVPGWEFYYDGLIAQTPDILNKANGCDLQDVSPLGTASVTATARYPGQSVDGQTEPVSNPLTETIYNSFSKDVRCARKGTTGDDQYAYICTASSIDIDDTAMEDSKVCFLSKEATSITAYPAGTPSTIDGLNRICVQTDWNGEASVQVNAKCQSKTSNVLADFVDEAILRFATVDFSACPGQPPATTTSTTTTTPTSTTTTGTTTTTPRPPTTTTTTPKPPTTTTTTSTPAPTSTTTSTTPPSTTTTTTTTTPTTTTPAPKMKVVLVRIQVVSFGKPARYVNVRVDGPGKSATIQVRLVKANGKTLRRLVRVVPTNRVTRVPKLKLDSVVATVKVSLAA